MVFKKCCSRQGKALFHSPERSEGDPHQLRLYTYVGNRPLDNVEGMTFGPRLRDGRRTLLLVSDNNFAATQFTQFLLFAYDD